MKNIPSLPRIALLVAAAATSSLSAFAQTPPTPTTSTAPAPAHGNFSFLTDDEKAQLKKAHDAALDANPDLKTEEDSLMQKRDALGSDASADDKAALRSQYRAFMMKMRPAELKVDPALAPIFTKMDAARKAREAAASQ